MPFEFWIGQRHLRARHSRFISLLTALAILGVAGGVAALVTVVSITGGFVHSFRERVLGVNPHVLILKMGAFFPEHGLVTEAVSRIDGVAYAVPFLQHEMLVTSPNARQRPGALVRGTDMEAMMADPMVRSTVMAGELARLRYRGQLADGQRPTDDADLVGVAMGNVLAERLRLQVGDTFSLVSPLRGIATFGMGEEDAAARSVHGRFRLEVIVASGFYDFDNRLIVMDHRALLDLLQRGNNVMGVEVRLHNVDDTDRVMQTLRQTLTAGRYRAMDWREINRNLFSSLQLQKLYLSIVTSLLVVVASSVILCVLLLLVLEKRREIAILRAMGTRARSIMLIFMVEGLVIGFWGTLLGLGLGWVACQLVQRIDFGLEFEVYRIDHLPVTVNPVEFALCGGAALLLCLVATIYPSWKAARVVPLDALRYEV
jgi:lipoprotein-releasing system permease protein